jgi:hypothetical protein
MWGDDYFHETFDKYVEDDTIEIEYKYGEEKNDMILLKWRIPEDTYQKVRVVRFGGSSRFAMWWSSASDGCEEEDD